jgi:signal transduction histidine kinase
MELRRSLRDIVGLLALPSLSSGKSRQGVLVALLDALSAMVPTDVSYARTSVGGGRLEAVCSSTIAPERVDMLRAAIAAVERPGLDAVELDDGKRGARLVVAPIGFYADGGVLALVSERPSFPTQRERLLIRTATALGAAALENARLLESLHEADRRKDQFLALLGHELRNPLAPVLSAVELMKLRSPARDDLRDVIERQAHHMRHLVDDLLDVSRITRGQLALNPQVVELREVIARSSSPRRSSSATGTRCWSTSRAAFSSTAILFGWRRCSPIC